MRNWTVLIFIIGHWSFLVCCCIWRISWISKCNRLICISWWLRIISIKESSIRKGVTIMASIITTNNKLNYNNKNNKVTITIPHTQINFSNCGHLSKASKITFVSHKTPIQKITFPLITSSTIMTHRKYLSNTLLTGLIENTLKLTPSKRYNPH